MRSTRYKNAMSIRIPNRRITVVKYNDVYEIEYQLVTPDPEPKIFHKRIRDRVTVTTHYLSKEGAEALCIALIEMLKQ